VDPASSIELLARYGSVAGLVFVTIGFVYGFVLTRGHHEEIVELWKSRLNDSDERCQDLARENSELRQALMLTNSQATRATGVLAQVVERDRPR
jgi:cell shape-determining protein MreC